MPSALEVLGLNKEGKSAADLLGIDPAQLQQPTPGPSSRFRGTQAALEKGLDEKFFENAPEIIGGTVGGMVGTVGGIPGRVGGAAIGGAIGKAGQELYRGQRDPAAIAQESGMAALRQGGGQVIGEGITGVAGRLMRPFAKTVTPGIGPAREAFEAKGGQFLPSQVTDTRILDIAENVAEGSMLGGGTIRAFKESQQKVINQWADDVARAYGTTATPEEAGALIARTIEGKGETFHAMATGLYKQLDKMADTPVSTGPLKQFAATVQKGRATSVTPSATGETMIKKTLDLPDMISFEQAQALRSELMSVSRAEHGNVAEGVARRMTAVVDTAMQESAEKLSPEALQAWRTANSFWKQGKAQFENKFINSLVKKDPEKIVETVVKPGNMTTIKKLKAALDGESLDEFQGGVTRKLLTQATDVDGNVQANLFQGQLKKLGEPTLKEIYSESQLTQLKAFGKAAELAQKRATDGTGKMWIQLTQAGALVDLATLNIGGPISAAVVIGPPIISKMLTNPTTARWLTTGVLTDATSSKAGTMARRILAEAVKLGGRGAVTMLGSGEPAPIPETLPAEQPQKSLQDKVFDVGEGIQRFMKKPISEMFGG